jgi:hypothetical protein
MKGVAMKEKREIWGPDPRYDRVTTYRPDGEVERVAIELAPGRAQDAVRHDPRRTPWLRIALLLLLIAGAVSVSVVRLLAG